MFKKCIIFLLCISILLFVLNWAMRYLFPIEYKEIIENQAKENDLEIVMIYAQIKAESNFKNTAVSKKGAVGLMQIMPETAVWCAEKMGIDSAALDLNDPETNIKIGCWYMRYLIEETGDTKWALAAYNAGLSHVKQWQSQGIDIKNIPFEETKNYIEKIEKSMKIYEFYAQGGYLK